MKTGLILEGGCTDSVPVKAFRNMGFSKNVVLLTRQAGYVKSPEKIQELYDLGKKDAQDMMISLKQWLYA